MTIHPHPHALSATTRCLSATACDQTGVHSEREPEPPVAHIQLLPLLLLRRRAHAHVEYCVATAMPGNQQRQRWTRFSDLVTLHNQLCSCFATTETSGWAAMVGVAPPALPKLPPKTWGVVSATKGSAFCEKRRVAIEKYLHELLQSKRGLRLPYLLDFLGLGVPPPGQAAAKQPAVPQQPSGGGGGKKLSK